MSKSPSPKRQRLNSCPAEIDRNKKEPKPVCKRLIPFQWEKKAIVKWLKENPISDQTGSSSLSTVSTSMINALRKTTEKFGSTSRQLVREMRENMQCGFMQELMHDRLLNYSHFNIPDSDWTIVRPHEFERDQFYNLKSDELHLPAVPGERVFYINRLANRAEWWEIPADLKNDNGVKMLAADQRLLAHQKELLELIYIIAKNYDSSDFGVQTILSDPSFYGFEEEEKMLEIFKERKKTGTTENKRFASNYFLLDPREFKTKMYEDVPFHEFIQSIFYIGKTYNELEGPISHLKNTFNLDEKEIQEKYGVSFKRNRIRQIWQAGRGVIIHLIYTYIDEQEALFRRECMIRARMGKNNFVRKSFNNIDNESHYNQRIMEYWKKTILGPIDLTNKKDELTEEKKAELGVFDWSNSAFVKLGSRLLLRAFGIFRLERHEEIFEADFDFKEPDEITANLSRRRYSSSSYENEYVYPSSSPDSTELLFQYSSQHYTQQQSQHFDNTQSNHHSSSSSSEHSSSQSPPPIFGTSLLPAGQLTLDEFLIKKQD